MRGLGLVGDFPELGIPYNGDFSLDVACLDLTHPSYKWLQRVHGFYGSNSLAAGGAGNFSVIELSRVTGDARNIQAYVDAIWLNNRNAAVAELCFAVGPTAVAGNAFTQTYQSPDDDRQPAGTVIQGYHIGASNATVALPASVAGGGSIPIRLAANTGIMLPVSITLMGRNRLFIFDQAANSAISAAFHWTERVMLPTEVTPA